MSSVVVSKVSVAVSLLLIGVIMFCVTKVSPDVRTSFLRASKLSFSSGSTATLSSSSIVAGLLTPAIQMLESAPLVDDADQAVVASSKFRQFGSLDNYMADNLVLGLAEAGTEENLAIFVGSLLKHTNSSDVIVFMASPVSQRSLEIARQANAVIVEYDMASVVPSFIARYHSSTLRWILFDQYMSQNEVLLGDKYQKVLFADVKDTAFQADPFALLPIGSGFVFQEGSVTGTPISHCQWTSGFIKEGFGDKILASVQDKTVVNVGVTLASYDKARYYVKLMSSVLLGESGLTTRFPSAERAGMDQGAHNVIVHLGLVPGLELKSEVEFPLVNIQSSEVWNNPGMQLENLQTHTYDRDLNVIKIQPLAIVHQYDSVTSLTQELAEIYVYWKNYDDAVEMWHAEKSCSVFNAFEAGNLGDVTKGQGEIGTARVTSADQCCSMCSSMKTCAGFFYGEGVCHFKSAKVTDRSAAFVKPALNWRPAEFKPFSPIQNKVVRLNAFK